MFVGAILLFAWLFTFCLTSAYFPRDAHEKAQEEAALHGFQMKGYVGEFIE
jgi:hypothetical protein